MRGFFRRFAAPKAPPSLDAYLAFGYAFWMKSFPIDDAHRGEIGTYDGRPVILVSTLLPLGEEDSGRLFPETTALQDLALAARDRFAPTMREIVFVRPSQI